MKEISELKLPENVKYTEDHEWVRPADGKARIGISDYAQDQLGDIVYVELPDIGSTFKKGEAFGTVESVKAVSDLYMPVGGEILSTNTALEESPEWVNGEPYDEGWMIEIKLAAVTEPDSLMSRDAYIELLKG
ncbi:MAG: glycine cleavage system protein GcvH [Desulfobacterales bacterium]|jgi:glycine cleavage system H protein|nr:glycine cleavage system protein GcvH [Desulfobacterales bacterium]MDP6681651.1 glycine cleavage system protein GcvH [Desulfobacterales bacterium]MDP6806723.1 glycine cleavage system protein GcvH [Desulfobacterales bacterium]|tara:strand:- start:17678 stop:18076 length:399 start_codon:yes stop_codon:yes gene_type:complete